MIRDAARLIEDFKKAAAVAGVPLLGDVDHESQVAPHTPHALRPGKCAVYVFSLSESYGGRCPAGAHRVLKVGKAGPNSCGRFQSQHYSGSAQSTLIGSIQRTRILWPYLGIGVSKPELLDGTYWLPMFTDRDNFYLDAANNGPALDALEHYLKACLGPVFEGTAKIRDRDAASL